MTRAEIVTGTGFAPDATFIVTTPLSPTNAAILADIRERYEDGDSFDADDVAELVELLADVRPDLVL